MICSFEHLCKRVEEIRQLQREDDNVAAHVKEDELFEDFIRFVADPYNWDTYPDEYYILELMAKEILKIREIEIDRWYE